MAFQLDDYLLDTTGADAAAWRGEWSWLLPDDCSLWLANRFADLFFEDAEGAVWRLDVSLGTLTHLAADRDEFCDKLDAELDDWLMVPLVDRCVAAGLPLSPGRCYGFRMPPIVGGSYAVENVATLPIADYLGCCGSIHRQLQDLPDGATVRFEIISGEPASSAQETADVATRTIIAPDVGPPPADSTPL